MDFKLIKQARMTQQEFATLVGVSRVTVNLWVRGKMHPTKASAAHVQTHLDMLDWAMQNEHLPFKKDVQDRGLSARIFCAMYLAQKIGMDISGVTEAVKA